MSTVGPHLLVSAGRGLRGKGEVEKGEVKGGKNVGGSKGVMVPPEEKCSFVLPEGPLICGQSLQVKKKITLIRRGVGWVSRKKR